MSCVISLSPTLVSQITGLQPEDEDGEFRAWVDVVKRSLDFNVKAAPSSSMNDVTKQLHGSVSHFTSHSLLTLCSRIERARINAQDCWADALEHSFSLLKSSADKIHDIDSEITVIILNIHAVHLADCLA